MLRNIVAFGALAGAVLSFMTGPVAYAEVLVPLQEYLSVTTRLYEANRYKTAYTIYVPQLELHGNTIIMNPKAVGEPVRLPVTKKNGVEYIDLEQTTPMIGVTYTVDKGKVQLSPAPETMEVIPHPKLQTPLAWAFDPWPQEGTPYNEKLNTSGDNIISPSWFKLHSLGLEASGTIQPDYVKAYKEKGFHVWPLITNRFDPAFTSGILRDENLWKKYAHNLIQYAYIYGFDGYNFDFENIDYADRDRLTRFVAYLADELHKYNIMSSIDVTGYSSSPEWSMVYNRKAFAHSVDYVVLMAYDETWAKSTKAGPVASYPWVRNHVTAMLSEVPHHKLVLGIPFYMRLWHDNNGWAKGETLAMKNTASYFTQYKDRMTWDESLKLYYLSLPVQNGEQRIWFEDNTSLAMKLNLVKEYKLAGFAAWRKGFEDVTTIEMIRGTDLGKGIPVLKRDTESATTVEPVVNSDSPHGLKLEAYQKQLDEKAKRKAEKKALKEREKVERKATAARVKAQKQAEKERLQAEKQARKERLVAEQQAEKERLKSAEPAAQDKGDEDEKQPSSVTVVKRA